MSGENIETLSQLLEAVEKAGGTQWWIYAAATDEKVRLEEYHATEECKCELLKKERKLLELRIFSEKAEYRAFRGHIGADLHFGEIIDAAEKSEDYFDETQYLEDNLGEMKIRNYISYYEKTGQAYVKDWRVVEWIAKGGVVNG